MTLGKIRIKDKVYFEPEGLEKPKERDYYKHVFIDFETVPVFKELVYNKAMKEYEASKQLVEVSNYGEKYICPQCGDFPDIIYPKEQRSWCHKCVVSWFYVTNNQSCKAEVNGTATIIELL